MKRTLAYPILAVLAVAAAALANLAVYQAGMEWFVGTPSISVVIRNTAATALLLFGGWWLLPKQGRHGAGETFLLIAGLLFGLGSAMQFRLGHDAPPRLSAAQVQGTIDSVSRSMPGVVQDSVLRTARRVIRARNTAMRRNFEATRIDVRLARSLEKAYGNTPITDQILDARRTAPSDSMLFRILPVLIALVTIGAVSRLRLTDILSSRWQFAGVGGSVLIAVATYIYLKTSGGIRGAAVAPQELLKLTLPIAWAGLLIRYHDAFIPESRERFTRSPLALWLYVLALLSAPLLVFVLVRDFGQFLVIGLAQTLLLAWVTRSPLYIVLFSAGFLASGVILLSGDLPTGVTLGTALAIVVAAVAVIGWLERFRRRDVLWTSASLVLAGYVAVAAIASQLGFVARLLSTPRARFTLWADLYARNGDPHWWDRSRQVIEALYSFDAAGWQGRGLGRGTPFLIPNAGSDFAYAALVEELGIIGGVIVLVLFIALVAIGLRISTERGRSSFVGLMVAGLTLLIGSQALIHIAGTMNLMPMTGITLPFISSGMSSMVVVAAMVGLIVAAAAGDREGEQRIVVRRDARLNR